MTLYQFNGLSYDYQVADVHETGTYLATRWYEECEAILLYQMPGRFFVELTYRVDTTKLRCLFAFESRRDGE